MPRFAMQLTSEFMSTVSRLVNADQIPDFFTDKVYLVLEAVGPTEFSLKFMTEEEIFDEMQSSDDLEFVSL